MLRESRWLTRCVNLTYVYCTMSFQSMMMMMMIMQIMLHYANQQLNRFGCGANNRTGNALVQTPLHPGRRSRRWDHLWRLLNFPRSAQHCGLRSRAAPGLDRGGDGCRVGSRTTGHGVVLPRLRGGAWWDRANARRTASADLIFMPAMAVAAK
jgi:hypothetical protein